MLPEELMKQEKKRWSLKGGEQRRKRSNLEVSFKLREPNPKGETRVSLCSIEGYKVGSPDKNNDINVIHSSSITMEAVPHDIKGTDDLGNVIIMKPGKNYKFPGSKVTETPLTQKEEKISKIYNEGYTAPGQAYAIYKSKEK